MEFAIGTSVYRTGKMNAFTQLHVVRRLTPCFGKLVSLARAEIKIKHNETGNVEDIDGSLEDIIKPIGEAFMALSDADLDYVLHACLAVTERKQTGGTWSFIRVNGVTMFDLTLPTLLQIAFYVCKENLSDFLGELPSLSNLQDILKARGLTG